LDELHPPVVEDDSCANCHDPHASGEALLRTAVPALCAECHAEILAQGHQDELEECTQCHDPHQSLGSSLARGDFAQQCAACHDGVGEGKTVHPALEEGCEACHNPHTNDNIAAAQRSCTKCHDQAEESEWASLHGRLAIPVEACVGCHPPHTSKREALVRGQLHYPLTQGQCAACHGEGEERSVAIEEVAERCRKCHPVGKDLKEQGTVLHDPVAEGECSTCHDPHLSDRNALLRVPQPELCGDCHDLPPAGDATVVHEAVETCTDCHDPHGGKRAPFLTADPPELCLDCHDDPREGEGEVHPALDEGCLACHHPHAGVAPGLLAGETRHAACLDCHDDPLAGKNVIHEAVSGGCSTCHRPHASEHRHLLNQGGNDLCLECHDRASHPHPLDAERGTAKYPASAQVPRSGNDYACWGCHAAHAADEAGLFRAPKARLCAETCHPR
jgi:predicted CXXCH cytochrome family protein